MAAAIRAGDAFWDSLPAGKRRFVEHVMTTASCFHWLTVDLRGQQDGNAAVLAAGSSAERVLSRVAAWRQDEPDHDARFDRCLKWLRDKHGHGADVGTLEEMMDTAARAYRACRKVRAQLLAREG